TVNNDNTNFYSDNNYLYSGDNILVLVPQTLKTVVIPEGTKSISDYACYATNATGITLPQSIVSIGNYAFAESKTLKSISINDNTKIIGSNAFENCISLKLLALPDFVENIGSRAFAGCINLASIILSSELAAIGDEAFEGCTSLTGLVFPEELQSIGKRAFADCTSLEYAYIWYSNLEENVFQNDSLLTIYTMAGTDAYRYAREYNDKYSAYTDEDIFYYECAIKIDVLAGYLGFCDNGHGDIQYLTVYENDCENDGYVIGVCEYCSEILEEIHTDAKGHNYTQTANIPATETTKGITVYTCTNCNSSYYEYSPALSEDFEIETHTVSGSIVIATNKNATTGKTPAKNVNIIIDGFTVATTDSDGKFTFELETGVYEAQLKYAYGFTRTIYILVEDKDIIYDSPIPIIGCDFNKDGKIDNDDLTLFQYIVSSKRDDVSYLEFVDMNNDGYINAKDRMYINSCIGLNAKTMHYSEIIIKNN
ncbi:MAG: leucine-rich repeat protein, partial [Eubacterium sp.]